MNPRVRKLIGLMILLAGLTTYALLMMRLAIALDPLPKWAEIPFYLGCGIGWIIWAAPLISWMNRPAD